MFGGGHRRRARFAEKALGLLLASATALITASCGGVQRSGGADARINVEALPPDIREAYGVFASHCSRCHTITRPLNAYVRRVEHWDKYVHRMMRQPGSGINQSEAKVILKWLHYYTLEIKGLKPVPEPPPEAEPVGADLIPATSPSAAGPAGTDGASGSVQGHH